MPGARGVPGTPAPVVTSCSFCGRRNEDAARFCLDCGKPVSASAARVVPAASVGSLRSSSAAAVAAPSVPSTRVSPSPATSTAPAAVTCPHCARGMDAAYPFCPGCGKRTGFAAAAERSCATCGAPMRGADAFCARCGTAAAPAGKGGTAVLSAAVRATGPKLSLLDEDGTVLQTYTLDRAETVVGRSDGDICFRDDVYLSPLHAQFSRREGQLWIRDLGSRNGTWVFLDTPYRLNDGDVVLVGSQLLRFRRLGYPGPNPPEADATRRLGSLIPTADVALLAQLRADGSQRDTLHLSPGRNVLIGRETGDWVFPYDQTMSGRHAEVRSQDSDFYVQDVGSRNGIAIAVRGERELAAGQRVLLGDQVLRVESM